MAYQKTEAGQRAFKSRSVQLTPRQRSAFIMVDGKRTLGEVLDATSGLGVTREDLMLLIELDLIADTEESHQEGASYAPTAPAPLRSLPPIPANLLAADSRPFVESMPGFAPSQQPDFVASVPVPPPPAPDSETVERERYQRAYLIATKLTASLGLRGFRLNLAVEGAGSYRKLVELAPKIRDAVGPEKFKPLDDALNGR